MGYPLNQPYVQEAYLESAASCGLTLHSLNLGALLAEGTLNAPRNTPEFDYARRSLLNGFSVCEELSIPVIVLTLDPQAADAEESVCAHLEYAAALAADAGVEIAVESALPLPRIQQLLEQSDSSIKVCMDLLNPLRFKTGNPQEQILAFGRNKISHFHMKDSRASLFTPGQRGCVPLGEGDGEYTQSVQCIRSLSYEGWMITENYYYLPPMSDEGDDFLFFAKRDLATMKRSFSI